jgi:hypothetical protein
MVRATSDGRLLIIYYQLSSKNQPSCASKQAILGWFSTISHASEKLTNMNYCKSDW